MTIFTLIPLMHYSKRLKIVDKYLLKGYKDKRIIIIVHKLIFRCSYKAIKEEKEEIQFPGRLINTLSTTNNLQTAAH